MIHQLAATARRTRMIVALGLTAVSVLHAQTNDEARLTFGMSAGYIGSTNLWDVANQPVFSVNQIPPDIWHLHREMHSDLTVSGHFSYFGSPHIGITGDFTYLGLGTSDACNVVVDDGDPELTTACDALAGSISTASTTTIQGGLIFRPFSRSFLQPYFKGLVGFAFTPSSTIMMKSTYGSIGDTALVITIYEDDNWASIRPTWTMSFGVSTAPSSGYQLFAEVRDTWLPLGVVTGPTTGQGYVPASKTVVKSFPSILVGFDIVLAKQRGRRY